jgi:CBS domain containing-hemolysin-like protein
MNGAKMTFFYVNVMWAIVLFGILLWTTACVVLNAALRRGMGIMGMALSYAVLIWMFVEIPWREAAVTWSVFVAFGGVLTMVYELWARRKYAGSARAPRRIVRFEGVFMWPAMVPDAVGLMLNDAGIIPADERSETHEEDARRITGEMPIANIEKAPHGVP